MEQLIFASLSHTHYWYEVGMLKVPASQTYITKTLNTRTVKSPHDYDYSGKVRCLIKEWSYVFTSVIVPLGVPPPEMVEEDMWQSSEP